MKEIVFLTNAHLSYFSCRAKEVLRDLKCVEKSNEKSESVAMGFGLGFRVMGVKAGMSHNYSMCCARYCC